MKLVESRIVKASGEKSFAVFDSKDIDEEIWIVLDKGNAESEEGMALHRLDQSLLKCESKGGVVYHHIGPPIAVGKYEDLPRERRGFVFSD